MSFRFALPALQSVDGRAHREDETSISRLASHQQQHQQQQQQQEQPALSSVRSRPGPTSLDGSPAPASAPAIVGGPALAESPSVIVSPAPPVDQPPQRRNVVFPDPVAFRYLEEDPAVAVIERRTVLRGYELYLVEQWACSRQSPTLVIVTYTGDANHSVVVGVLGIPADERDWSPRLKVYFKAIQHYHARPRETPIGELMVTNLSGFPSALTVISVPDGDIRRHRQAFIVNEDLKRLGCSGRSGMSLSAPTKATQDKFLSLYKTSDRIPFDESVLELIKMCQTALFFFGKLEWEYIDGLLCDLTEKAINDWWAEVGSEYYNMEPTDGILGPTTVAALLGTLIGARNRLSWWGAPVAKDVFDVDCTKKGIGSFQKAYKLERTRRLDHQTLRKLHTVTAKAAAGEGVWGKAVKSTMEGFGGKRGELVIGMVGGKEKANIGDVETLDIDKFISLVQGERAKYLWHGKPRKSAPAGTGEHHRDRSIPDIGNLLLGKDEAASSSAQQAGGGRRGHTLPAEEGGELETRKTADERSGVYSAPPPGSAVSVGESPGQSQGQSQSQSQSPGQSQNQGQGQDKDALRKTVFKSVAGKVSDARSGLGRIRDAVGGGLRGHATRPSRDETPSAAAYYTGVTTTTTPSIASLAQSSASLSSPVVSRAFTWKNKPEEYMNGFRRPNEVEGEPVALVSTGAQTSETLLKESSGSSSSGKQLRVPDAGDRPAFPEAVTPGGGLVLHPTASKIRKDLVLGDVSVAGSVVDDGDLEGPFLEAERNTGEAGATLSGLQRRHSIEVSHVTLRCEVAEERWHRRMSFSAAEEAVLPWTDIVDLAEELDGSGGGSINGSGSNEVMETALVQHLSGEMARSLYQQMALLSQGLGPWAAEKVAALEALDDVYGRQQEELQALYYTLSEACRQARQAGEELVGEERARATEAVKDVEVLVARLEYEAGALASKVQDVEDGVRRFEAQVGDIERRADEVKAQLETESWLHWFVRTLTGVGTGPNIVQGPQRRRSGAT